MARLLPAAVLVQRIDLAGLIDERLMLARLEASSDTKALTVIGQMLAGGDSIDDVAVMRSGVTTGRSPILACSSRRAMSKPTQVERRRAERLTTSARERGHVDVPSSQAPTAGIGDSTHASTRLLTRAVDVASGSALDPRVEQVSWVAWRLLGSQTLNGDSPNFLASASLLARTAEALWLPGRLAALSDLDWDPATGVLAIRFAVGVFGARGSTETEATHVAAQLDSVLTQLWLPFSVAPENPTAVLDVEEADLAHSVLLRQRTLDVEVQGGPMAGESVDVLMRFNPVVNSAERVARSLVTRTARTRFRATILPTELGPDERSELDADIRVVAAARRYTAEFPELRHTLERAEVTLHDLKASFSTPLLCAEVALFSSEPLPELFCRSVGSAHTSESDVIRRSGHTTVAGQQLLLGGFEVSAGPQGHGQALRQGLPVFGGTARRTLRDVLSLTECPLAWPVPMSSPIPGLPASALKGRSRPALLDASDEACLGLDPRGLAVAVPWQKRTLHTFISGLTGTGKTTELDALVRGDIGRGRPFFLIDSHGPWYHRSRALCEQAGLKPMLFDIADGRTASIAPTPATSSAEGDGVVTNRDDVLAAARRFCDAFSSHLPNAEWTGPVWNQRAVAILELAAAHQVTLVVVLGWVGDPDRLRVALKHPHLSSVTRATLTSLALQTSGDGRAGVEWTTSKWTALATGPARVLLAAPGAGVDPGAALLNGGPVLINLSGLTPSDSAVMGHVLLSGILDTVLAAGPDPERQIAGYVDEAHRIAPHNLERAWTEARKFGLALTVASQTHNQFPSTAADLALGAGTLIAFRQAPQAAAQLMPLLDVPPSELTSMPDLQAVVRTVGAPACTITLPPYPDVPEGSDRTPRRRDSAREQDPSVTLAHTVTPPLLGLPPTPCGD